MRQTIDRRVAEDIPRLTMVQWSAESGGLYVEDVISVFGGERGIHLSRGDAKVSPEL